MLNKNKTDILNELLEKFEKEALDGNSTKNIKNEVMKFVSEQIELTHKSAYTKGYRTGRNYLARDDWEYDPGDSRG